MIKAHLLVVTFALPTAELAAEDCNANGVPDELDVRPSLELHAARLLVMPGLKIMIAAGDFDGDGTADFVSASEINGTFPVQAHLNDGSGGFHAPSTYNLLSESTDLAVADLDGDGDQDVAATSVLCCQFPGRTWVLWNDGDGELARGPLLTSTETASTPRSVVALDVDGDSDVDLAVAQGDVPKISIYHNDGRGELGQELLFPAGEGTRHVAAADFDRDGDLDLAASVYDPQSLGTVLLLNDGDGLFTPSGVLRMARGATALLTRDLDGDGYPEVVAAAADDLVGMVVHVYWNNRDGSFGSPEGHEIPNGAMEIEAADLNGDGGMDLVLPTYVSEGIAILFSTGGRAFSVATVPTAERSTASLPVDIEGDGSPDLLVPRNDSNLVTVLENDTEGRFVTARQVDILTSDAFAAADMNADGRLDLLGVSDGPLVWVALQKEDRSFPDPTYHTWTGRFEMKPMDLEVVDLDGDGDMEVAVLSDTRAAEDPGTLSILINDGDGLLDHSMNREVGSSPQNVVAADLDGDGDTDIASSSFGFMPPGDVSIFLNLGDAFLAPAEHLAIEARPGSLGVGDLNGDGAPDLAFSMQSSLWAFLNDGAGDFSPLRIFDSRLGTEPPVLADLDGDADLDVALMMGGAIIVLINRGNSVFEKGVEMPAGSSARNLVTVDLDGDGDLELVEPDPGVAVFENLGGAEFLPRRLYESLGIGRLLVAADLDGDGDRDLLTGAPGKIGFIENTSRPPASKDSDSNSIPDECERPTLRRGDTNDDAEIDIADPIFLLNSLFLGGPSSRCAESADQDNDGVIGLSDGVHLLNYLFRGGPIAPPPGPFACERDPDPLGSAGDLGCDSYTSC